MGFRLDVAACVLSSTFINILLNIFRCSAEKLCDGYDRYSSGVLAIHDCAGILVILVWDARLVGEPFFLKPRRDIAKQFWKLIAFTTSTPLKISTHAYI